MGKLHEMVKVIEDQKDGLEIPTFLQRKPEQPSSKTPPNAVPEIPSEVEPPKAAKPAAKPKAKKPKSIRQVLKKATQKPAIPKPEDKKSEKTDAPEKRPDGLRRETGKAIIADHLTQKDGISLHDLAKVMGWETSASANMISHVARQVIGGLNVTRTKMADGTTIFKAEYADPTIGKMMRSWATKHGPEKKIAVKSPHKRAKPAVTKTAKKTRKAA